MEQKIVEHIRSLLNNDRLRIDTTRGRRPIKTFLRHIQETDRAMDLKRQMAELNKPDRDLQNRMPVGKEMEIILSQRHWGLFKKEAGRLRAVCVSPVRELLEGSEIQPLTTEAVERLLSVGYAPSPSPGTPGEGWGGGLIGRTHPHPNPPPEYRGRGNVVPITLILASTSGFTREAHQMSERRSDRTIILLEPNDAGGWQVSGPQEVRDLLDLLDPEAEAEKHQRIEKTIEEMRGELFGSGVAADRLAAKVELPIQLVEAHLKTYAKSHAGLAAKRLHGRIVLFRDGPAESEGVMPLKDRLLNLLGRKGETEKKIAYLAERRALLGQQRDRVYEELQSLEAKEGALREEFIHSNSDTTKRRVTSQLVQLRREITRRQQLIDVLNRQVEIVGSHQHSLELVRTGGQTKTIDAEAMSRDAAAAEEMLAQLQANTELIDSVVGTSTISAEEQALYEELELQSRRPETPPPAAPKKIDPPKLPRQAEAETG
jgi:hypothetical protein